MATLIKKATIELDPDWSAQRVADEIRLRVANALETRPEMVELCEKLSNPSVHASELWAMMTSGEKEGIPDIPIIAMPTGTFNSKIATSPNGEGQFVTVDICVFWELTSFLSAIGRQPYPAWMACTLQGALRGARNYWDKPIPHWVEGPAREMASYYGPPSGLRVGEVAYTDFHSMLVGRDLCMKFILAHEYAHYRLGHLARPSFFAERGLRSGLFQNYKTGQIHEFEADALALDITSRVATRHLATWQISIELMFWYLSLIELFNTGCQIIRGEVTRPGDHPTWFQRAQYISKQGEAMLSMRLQGNPDDAKELVRVLEQRQRIFRLWRQMCHYALVNLAEAYCYAPDRTVALHDAVVASTVDRSGYEAEMKAIQVGYGARSPLMAARRGVRYLLYKML